MIPRYYRKDDQILYEMGIGESVGKLVDIDEIPKETLFEWFKRTIDGIIMQLKSIMIIDANI